MSIINEALKKTQKTLQNDTKPPASSNRPNGFWIIAVLIFIGFVACLFLFISVVITSRPLTVESRDALTETASALSPAKSDRGLVLNGITGMDNGYVALINNRILKEGDFIGKKRISKITAQSVEIVDSGRSRILMLDE